MENYNTNKIKYLKSKYKKNLTFQKIIQNLEDKFGDKAIHFLLNDDSNSFPMLTSTSIFISPNIQTFSCTTQGLTSVFGADISSEFGSPNYNFGIVIMGNNASNSPQMCYSICQEGTLLNGNTIPINFAGMHGYTITVPINATKICSNVSQFPNNISNSPNGISSGAYLCFRELNKIVTVTCGNPITNTFTYDMTANFTSNTRYFHIYRQDAGVVGATHTFNIIPSLIV